MNVAQPIASSAVPHGDTLPFETIVCDLTSLVVYAAATWDFHRYHYDTAFVKALDMPAPFVDGQMIGALLASRLMRWGGPDAFVRKLAYRQRTTVFVDETIILGGKVTARTVETGRKLVTFNLSVQKPDGTFIVRDGTATVDLGPA
jgi:hydroxyacyl-ACP dehydratase HTD2-like protein with hotdog domain